MDIQRYAFFFLVDTVLEALIIIAIVNNKKNKPNTVDLHGLFVEEAKEKAKEVLQSALARQEKQIRFIVGKVSDAADVSLFDFGLMTFHWYQGPALSTRESKD